MQIQRLERYARQGFWPYNAGHPMKKPKQKQISFVACVRNDGYEASLEIGKVYVVLPDAKAVKFGRIRVIDESEEDYLFPAEYFLPVELSKPARDAASAA
jgi:hypothetical protein